MQVTDYRVATQQDVLILVLMNQQLIQDEGHHNPMNAEQLDRRMAEWLAGEYQAVIFSGEDTDLGYALFKYADDHVYLRQFFVHRDFRRQGVGRAAMQWLRQNAWKDAPRVRVEVLANNHRAHAFWKAVGFADYAVTLEMETDQGE